MKEGLLKTYSDAPPRPNVPPRPRPTTTNFPPPPRPPPPSANKPSYSPPLSGAKRYERFGRARSGWGHSDSEDAKTKTNDFKAWEQMRHGSGPIPTKRAPPPTPNRKAGFEPGKRESPPGRAPYESIPKPRGAWEDLRDAGMPNFARDNTTTRAPPRRAGFVPNSPPVENPPRSAYFNVSTGDRPKSSSEMPPPPLRPSTFKKPDTLRPHTRRSSDLNKDRVSTHY